MECSHQSMRPILITGTHRSGTTWTGKTLAQSPALFYIQEPFNPDNNWAPLTVQKKPFHNWYTYIHQGNEDLYMSYIQAVLGIGFQPLNEIKSIKSIHDIARVMKRGSRNYMNNLRGIRSLMKDPIALFSAEWLADKFDMHIVITIRHPAAFVESLMRLDWQFDFSNLNNQDKLVETFFPEYGHKLDEFSNGNPGILESAVFQWILYHHVISTYRENHKDWIFVRHEDLSRDPIGEFRKLFEVLGIKFSSEIQQHIEDNSSSSNPVETITPHIIKRDSKATVMKWKHSLSSEQISYIRDHIEACAFDFYSDDDW